MKKMLHKRGQRQRGVKQTLNVAPIDIILVFVIIMKIGGEISRYNNDTP